MERFWRHTVGHEWLIAIHQYCRADSRQSSNDDARKIITLSNSYEREEEWVEETKNHTGRTDDYDNDNDNDNDNKTIIIIITTPVVYDETFNIAECIIIVIIVIIIITILTILTIWTI
jgi:hypothetical protein